jgi:hypothetical protein
MGSDLNDLLRKRGPDAVRGHVDEQQTNERQPERPCKGNGAEWPPFNGSRPVEKSNWRTRVFCSAALQTMTFPPLRFVLPGLIPEGASLFVSRPKLGKSWLVLDLAIATAGGRFTLDLKPSPGAVLYLALEDGPRRLQRRMTKLLPTFSGSWPLGLTIATEWSRAKEGGLSDIEAWVQSVSDARLVIIDTLAQFRNLSTGKSQIYADDYSAISELQKLASKHNIAIIIVHHDRKSEADDPFDTVSGTLGLTGAADTILIMKRRAGAVTLHVRGRDIEEAEKALQFDKATCRWSILGEAMDVRRSDQRSRVLKFFERSKEPISPADLADEVPGLSRGNARQLLRRMADAGEIVKKGYGRYTRVTAVTVAEVSENSERFGRVTTVTGVTASHATALGPPELPEEEGRATNGTPDRLCDHCGRPGAAGPWNWLGRPDGVWLHPDCEGPWRDSEGHETGGTK